MDEKDPLLAKLLAAATAIPARKPLRIVLDPDGRPVGREGCGPVELVRAPAPAERPREIDLDWATRQWRLLDCDHNRERERPALHCEFDGLNAVHAISSIQGYYTILD